MSSMESGATVVKVFLIDDHRIFLEGLEKLISDDPSMVIVGTSCNSRDGIREVPQLQPDVVLMDISMPGLNGLEGTRMISRTCPKTRILILTMHDNELFLRRALEAGSDGYILKDSKVEELLHAIQETYKGNCYLSPSISRKLVDEYLVTKKRKEIKNQFPVLTGREWEVLQLLAKGHTNNAIAKVLGISQKTVQTHRKQIMKKTEYSSDFGLGEICVGRGFNGSLGKKTLSF
jgi:two-component system response regulator NreC